MSAEPSCNPLGGKRLHRSERAELSRMLRERLSAEEILLYDAAGNPILKGSDLWTAGQAECRRQAHILLDHLLDQVLPSALLSAEKLTEALKGLSQSDPKYTFNVIDGKLSLPFNFTVGQVKLNGHIPLYRLVVLTAAVMGLWLVRSIKNEPRKAHPPGVNSRKFATWRVITLGTQKSSTDLAAALKRAGFEVGHIAAEWLNKITLAPVETEIGLVNVSARELGFENPTGIAEIYTRAAELGLDLVPAETGPQLRLQYADQPQGEDLAMGMKLLRFAPAELETLVERRLRVLESRVLDSREAI